jgi:hypothetical protein
LTAAPLSRTIAPGGVVTYTLTVQPVGSFSATVTLVAASSAPSLTLGLTPAVVTLPGVSTLTVTDTHTGSALLPGLQYTISITGTGGGLTRTANVNLLVGGMRVYLPLILRE